jgi:hypothetical protein
MDLQSQAVFSFPTIPGVRVDIIGWLFMMSVYITEASHRRKSMSDGVEVVSASHPDLTCCSLLSAFFCCMSELCSCVGIPDF